MGWHSSEGRQAPQQHIACSSHTSSPADRQASRVCRTAVGRGQTRRRTWLIASSICWLEREDHFLMSLLLRSPAHVDEMSALPSSRIRGSYALSSANFGRARESGPSSCACSFRKHLSLRAAPISGCSAKAPAVEKPLKSRAERSRGWQHPQSAELLRMSALRRSSG